MIPLNFPEYEIKIKEEAGKTFVFDPVRKRYVALTPEEWVRQHAIRYLTLEKGVPLTLMKVESEIELFNTRKRFDIAVFDRNGRALMVVECKAPSVLITQDVLDQAVRYNMSLQVEYLLLTNGLQHHFLKVQTSGNEISRPGEFPHFSKLTDTQADIIP
jgi:predicted type IV restriction endonuclease